MQMLAQEFSDIKSPSDTGFESSVVGEAVASLPTILGDVVFFLDKINMHVFKGLLPNSIEVNNLIGHWIEN